LAHYATVDHDRGILVVFSPKCASNSIRHWLEDARWKLGRDPAEVQMVPLEMIGEYRDLLAVAVVRDPIRRLIGYYGRFVVPGVETWLHADDAKHRDLRDCSFRDVVGIVAEVAGRGHRLQHHLVPQIDGIQADFTFDEVLVVERLDDDLARLSRRLGHESLSSWRENEKQYGGGPPGPAADRPAAWFVEHGLPEKGWFIDDDLVDIIRSIYAADVRWYFAQPGTKLLAPAIS
jgi:hypothetical protein